MIREVITQLRDALYPGLKLKFPIASAIIPSYSWSIGYEEVNVGYTKWIPAIEVRLEMDDKVPMLRIERLGIVKSEPIPGREKLIELIKELYS
jgi:hypothetical protein